MNIMKAIQTGFFTHEIQLRQIDEIGDPLSAISRTVDFESFRPMLNTLLGTPTGGVGRPPWDQVLMLRILVLQIIRGLSDEMIEFELIDSASAQRFAGISPHDPVPDSRTIWLFRDSLSKSKHAGQATADGTSAGIDGARALFDQFHQMLAEKGLLCREGKTVDAMILEVPRQRNSRKENESVKNGVTPGDWKTQPRKLAQKDLEARWTRKRDVNYYGYKNSIVGGNTDNFVHDYVVAPANSHDSQIIPGSYFKPESEISYAYGDSAYSGAPIAEKLEQANIISHIHTKGSRDKPLSAIEVEINHLKSKVRVRIEHRFGRMKTCLHGLAIRGIGLVRNRSAVGLINLVYNMLEYSRLQSPGPTKA